MRRKDKEITDQTVILSILQEAEVCRLAFATGDYPYIVPVNFAYHAGCLYIHSAREGKKLEMLRQNNLVCFEVESRVEIVSGEQACSYSTRYMSVIGYGRVSLVDEPEAKRHALDLIMQKYSGKGQYTYSEEALQRIIVLMIEVTELSGKKSKL